jgi:hypothetical protein
MAQFYQMTRGKTHSCQIPVTPPRLPTFNQRDAVFTITSKKKVEPFTIDLARAVSAAEIEEAMETAFSHTMLPDKTPYSVPLKALVTFEQTENSLVLNCTPEKDAVDAEAVRWCQALTRLPHKSLPRSQRPVIKLLQKLPPLPTGNVAHDRGRRAVLDKTLASLWPAIKAGVTESLQARAQQGLNNHQVQIQS